MCSICTRDCENLWYNKNERNERQTDRNEKTGYKIREAQLQKIPYMLIVGAKEVEENIVSVRSREQAENQVMKVDEFKQKIKEEIDNKKKTEI